MKEEDEEFRPPRPNHAEREKICAAADKALKVFPNAIGEYIATELYSWEQLSLRLDQKGVTARMIQAVLDMPDAT